MKRARSGGDEEAPRQNGTAGGRRGEQQQQSDGDNGGCDFGPADLQDDDNDPGLRREIRSKYRDLINSVQREWDAQAYMLMLLLLLVICWQTDDVFPPCVFSENREDMLSPSNNKLTEVLEEANKLFKDGECHATEQMLVMLIIIIIIQFDLCSFTVRQAREAALDAQLLVVATDLGKEKATQLFAEGNTFDPTAFAEHLVSEFVVYTSYDCVLK